ncbi:Hpt domain-containing protein [Moraxella macacae 0408225]|uniref:Hpt domain-containing protein n=1 Tax=Moraxella macacae 0408225 TaxID=1230338 RepID=L2F5G9_9GAMM|nr:Hpt domain-containing protein [Moraxella macacae]ELA08304.1 Hpt domain-containing protein [Moraxella macacae 0408225]
MSSQHISQAQFEELRDLLEDDFIDLINTYMSDSEQRLEEMQVAFDNDDNRMGFEASHSLKGASSNLGATHLTEMCYQLQEICRGGQIHKHQQLIHEIKAESQAVNNDIKQLINSQ